MTERYARRAIVEIRQLGGWDHVQLDHVLLPWNGNRWWTVQALAHGQRHDQATELARGRTIRAALRLALNTARARALHSGPGYARAQAKGVRPIGDG